MASRTFSFTTDTATMCVFDLESLKHRLEDDADWWSVPREEVKEVNAGHALFLGLGADGRFEVVLLDEIPAPQVRLGLSVPSGRLFIGAAEEVTGEGLEPEKVRGGEFVELEPGPWTLHARQEGHRVEIALLPGGSGTNKVKGPVRLQPGA